MPYLISLFTVMKGHFLTEMSDSPDAIFTCVIFYAAQTVKFFRLKEVLFDVFFSFVRNTAHTQRI